MKYLIAILFISINCLGQKHGDRESMRERIEARRVSYITKMLDLSPQEAQQFWPVYNEYREKKEVLRGQKPAYFSKNEKAEEIINAMGDAEIEASLKQEVKRQKEFIRLQEEYYEKLKKVISVKKIALLYHAEFLFQKRLMEHIVRKREKRKLPKGEDY